MMILTDRTSKLEIDLASWDGDAYITACVDSRGYSGKVDLHVLDGAFRKFCTEIVSLQKTLKGAAILNSISPGELRIEIKPFGSLGHISVVGQFGHHMCTTHTSNWHSVQFGFEIEPQELDRAVRVGWLKQYAN